MRYQTSWSLEGEIRDTRWVGSHGKEPELPGRALLFFALVYALYLPPTHITVIHSFTHHCLSHTHTLLGTGDTQDLLGRSCVWWKREVIGED